MQRLLFFLAIALVSCSSKPTKVATNAPSPTSFAAFDSDRDNQVQPDEYETSMLKLFELWDKNGNHQLEPVELTTLPKWTQFADQNKDGNVTVIEFLEAADAAYAKANSDQNKRSLSAIEFNTVAIRELDKKTPQSGTPRVCVGNYANVDIGWKMTTASTTTSNPAQRPDTRWFCKKTTATTGELDVVIVPTEAAYTSRACYFKLSARDFVTVTGSGSDIRCNVRRDNGAVETAEMLPFGSNGEAVMHGVASFGSPIVGATVRLYDEANTVVDEGVTGPAGTFSIAMTPPMPSNLRVEIYGGTRDGRPYEGTLSSYFSSFEYLASIARVNAFTTIVADTMKDWNKSSVAEVESSIKMAFGLPESPSLQTMMKDRSGRYFDENRFVTTAIKSGTINDYFQTLSTKMQSNSFTPTSYAVKPSKSSEPFEPSTWTATAVGGTVTSKTAALAFDSILNKTGIREDGTLYLLTKLDEAVTRLDALKDQVTDPEAKSLKMRVDRMRGYPEAISFWRTKYIAYLKTPDAAEWKQIYGGTKTLRDDILAEGKTLLVDINYYLTLPSDSKPTANPLINKQFFSNVYSPLEYWRSAESIAFAMVAAVYKAENSNYEMDRIASQYKKNVQTEVAKLPSVPYLSQVLRDKPTLEAIQKNQMMLDTQTGYLWKVALDNKPWPATKAADYLAQRNRDEVANHFAAASETEIAALMATLKTSDFLEFQKRIGSPVVGTQNVIWVCCQKVTPEAAAKVFLREQGPSITSTQNAADLADAWTNNSSPGFTTMQRRKYDPTGNTRGLASPAK